MYRLVLYYLTALIIIAGIFGAFGILPYSPIALAFSTAVLVAVSFITNELFARMFKAQPNVESVYITAFILALIIAPITPGNLVGTAFLIWAGVWAMASKYILAANKKHAFNPAAFAVALTALTIGQSATWWVGGNLPLMAFVIVGGLLVTRKIRRFDLVISFFAAAAVSIIVTSTSGNPMTSLSAAVLHAPLFFFAFVMLTEPLTTPPTRAGRVTYGILVGLMFAPTVHIGPAYSTPELALLLGNIFAYVISPKSKYVMKLKEKQGVGGGIYYLVFTSDSPLKFRPGQYMEWTLAHQKSDSRGNRRYFTIASSPTERDLRLGIRFTENGSSFKKRMLAMQHGDEIVGGQLAGDFTLPRNAKKKLAFIAGGIGITPFRSMIKAASDRDEKRDIILLYSSRTADDIAYRDIFDEATQKIGLRTIYAITDSTSPLQISNNQYPTTSLHSGRIDENLIRREIPDYRERTFYVSGTQSLVDGMTTLLHNLAVPRAQIKTDFFPGF